MSEFDPLLGRLRTSAKERIIEKTERIVQGGGSDHKVKVSDNDTGADFLGNKLVAGSNITITENNNGSNETLIVAAGGGGVTDATYITLSTNATLTDERILTGTANQIVVTDNGAGSTVVLSTPQNIHTGASPTFAGLTLSGLTTDRIPFMTTGGQFTDEAGFEYDAADNQIVVPLVGGIRTATDSSAENAFGIYNSAGNLMVGWETSTGRMLVKVATSGLTFKIEGNDPTTRFMSFDTSASLFLRYDDNAAHVNPIWQNKGMTGTGHGQRMRWQLGTSAVALTNAAELRVVSENTWSTTASTQNTLMSFWTGAAGAAPTEKMRIGSNGNVSIGTAAIATAVLHLKAGTTAASSAPLKFTTGTSMTAAEAGAVEFTTDDLFFTITTGPARKRLLMADPVGGLTSTRVPFATTNGRLTDDADMTFATDTLTVTKIVGTTSVKVGTAAGFISSDGSTGATGSFTTADAKTVTVKDGIITAIV